MTARRFSSPGFPWPAVSFDHAIQDCTGGQPKIQRRDYLGNGLIPVIDQGVREIAGFTDQTDYAYRGKLPVILFGDHTRAFKFVDSPFALGADGVKVLAPRDGFDAKFLYYYLSFVRLPNLGYSRHFKHLRQINVPLTPPSEQRRIVEILDQGDTLQKKCIQVDAKAERILPALFIKMFGDLARNPKGWPTKPLREVVDIGTRLTDPNLPDYLSLPHVGGETIEKETGRLLSPALVRNSDLRSSKFVFSEKHILYSKIRPYLNKVAFPRIRGVCSADIYPLLPKSDRVRPWYLICVLRSTTFLAFAKTHSERLRMPKLNRDQLGAFEIPIPDPTLLAVFEQKAQQIDTLKEGCRVAHGRVERLFNALLHDAVSGSLTAKWREAHADHLLREAEEQARVLGIAYPQTLHGTRHGRIQSVVSC